MPTVLETPLRIAALSAQEAAIPGGRNYMKKKALRRRVAAGCIFFSIPLFTLAFAQVRAMAAELAGTVQGAGFPIAGSMVTLYGAGAGAPTQLAQGKTDDNGAFNMNIDQTPTDSVFYLFAKGGTAKAAVDKSPNDTIALMAVLGTELPKTVTVNELTSVASTFTAARFINGEAISGNPLGLRIAAGNVPNLVDPGTGAWGKVILDPLNSTQTTTLANLNTLGSLISAFFTVADDDWRARFLKAATPIGGATPTNTLEAMVGIARRPWANANARCSTKPTRSRRTALGAKRHSCRISPTSRTTSPYRSASPAAGCAPMASSFSTPMAISGAARTGCRARSLALAATSVAARSKSPPTEPCCHQRSTVSGAWAWTESGGAPLAGWSVRQ
jgi:hypothetical protein